ncbi:hypothetical protein D3870_12405 [Noviherbaspirillum cavernae]|uniref:Carboxypeptidase regulatory-like domain-containing protein n=1 Tax=Noviherbaspirillum cavernae TaxID=2320862 RepID=A0A418X2K8_9BURK|nr:hypothetical protein [Noviherbaspirillum cavernae]RJG06703.1 hypothetical protein D3870_12405 [Noviherbaspirillum cavernae]
MKTSSLILSSAVALLTAPGLAQLPDPAPSTLPPNNAGPPAYPLKPELATPSMPGMPSPATSGDSGDSGTLSHPPADVQPMPRPASGSATSAPAPASRLQAKSADGITYLCGGIGVEEVGYMKRAARDYDLMLTFAARDGSYLADVNVEIDDAGGTPILQIACDGPILLVDLPKAGNYQVRADAAGYTVRHMVNVAENPQDGRKLAAAVLTWPQQVADGPGAFQSGR